MNRLCSGGAHQRLPNPDLRGGPPHPHIPHFFRPFGSLIHRVLNNQLNGEAGGRHKSVGECTPHVNRRSGGAQTLSLHTPWPPMKKRKRRWTSSADHFPEGMKSGLIVHITLPKTWWWTPEPSRAWRVTIFERPWLLMSSMHENQRANWSRNTLAN